MKRGRLSARAQATIFIIIAIVLIGAVAISLFAFKDTDFKGDFSSNADIQARFDNLRDSIQNCVKFTSEDAIAIIGMQGGYYAPPEKDSFDLMWISIPYYYDRGRFLMPSDAEINKQLGTYINDNLPDCLNELNFSGFTLDYPSKFLTTAVVKPDEVVFSIDMPVTIAREGKTFKFNLKDNKIVVNSKLYDMIGIAKYITDSHKEDPELMCISCVVSMAKEKGLFVDFLDFSADSSTTLVVISSKSQDSFPFAFEFLNKYNSKPASTTSTGV